MLKQAMASILTPEETEELYGAFDQIGSKIILRIPDSLLHKRNLIGSVLLEKVKTAKSIFYQSSPVEGDYRIRHLNSWQERTAQKQNTKSTDAGSKWTWKRHSSHPGLQPSV